MTVRPGTVVAIALLVVAPLMPGVIAGVVPAAVPGVVAAGSLLALLRLPVESIVILLTLALVPWRAVRIALAAAFGAFVVVAIALAGIDRGYQGALGIRFDPLDWQQLGDAAGVVAAAIGVPATTAILVVTAVGAVAAATALAWAVLRVDAVIRSRRPAGTTTLAAVTGVWIVAALVVSPLGPPRVDTGQPVAAAASAGAIGSAVSQASTALREQSALVRQIADDRYALVPPAGLLTALRGKDVVVAFIESYGQVAVQGTSFSGGVDAVLSRGDAALAASGYTTRSAWLTSPTFGGISWLAHSTLQSGVWVHSPSAYDTVVRTKRLTLSEAFRRAGWNTVSDVPSDTVPWAIGHTFYHYGTLLDATNVGYQGPQFGYALIPDQYTWKYVADHVLAGRHRPVMAEIDLVSSHTPWAPLPRLVPWSQIGDGSVYDPQPAQSEQADVVWRDPRTVQRFYGQSVQYSLGAMFSFLQHVDDPNLVVIALGDHQPASIVSGSHANHVVPISIIAKDPRVFSAIAGWHWQPGMQPAPDAPLWRMDAFRDRFLAAFSPG